jgi:mono/diheme cytochrome c family protein
MDYLVGLLQHDAWDTVAARVAVLGLTPAEILVSTAQNASSSAPDIDFDYALGLFSAHCSECHGEHGEGTFDAPQLYNAYVQSMSSDRLHTIVTTGVRNTKMAGFDTVLSAEEIDTLVLLLQNWYRPPEAVSAQPISLEEGQVGFETWCAPCHGMRGEGGSIAPSLNDLPAVPADFITSRVRSGQNAMPPFAESDLPGSQLVSIIAYAQQEIIGSGLPQISAEMLADGETLYAQQCAECHGEHGEGTEDDGPALVTVPPLRGRTIINFVRVGSSQTPGIPAETVSDAQLELIIAYIHSLSR